MIKKPDDALLANDDIMFINSGNVTFFCDEMGILSVDLNRLTLTMLVLMRMILKLLFMSDLWLGTIDLNKAKHVKRM